MINTSRLTEQVIAGVITGVIVAVAMAYMQRKKIVPPATDDTTDSYKNLWGVM
ncbi:MAG: hypothetical protein LC637_05040 [Xanthomonadaceae bacterium]|nr:hypothetical protein [Xanthomonadaceae bacterium]